MRAEGRDAGTLSLMVAVMALPIFALAGLVIDAGRALHARAEALSWAEEAARAGAQGVDARTLTLNTDDVQARATAFCDAAAASNAVGGHGTLTFPGGCTAAVNAAGGCVTMQAQVTISTGFLGLLGIQTMSETRSANAQADVGVDNGDAVAVGGGCP